MSRPRKKPRRVYIHDPTADHISTASTASNRRVHMEVNRAPPPSPEKNRTYDIFDRAMGFPDPGEMFDIADVPEEGLAGIQIKTKKKRVQRNTESDRPLIPFIPLRNVSRFWPKSRHLILAPKIIKRSQD
ncbi:hypothetical protein B0H12DRAFT_1231080 [Mycena haematopus]|nr:hypothetical protein B0H12DRAFT_1231080 [Mycena haematopus]